MSATEQQLQAIVIYKGNLSPALEDTIRVNNQLYDLTGRAVVFRMRPEDSTELVVDSPGTVYDQTVNKGRIVYQWKAGETDDVGEYRFWWNIMTDAGPQDTPEHPLIVREHGPGYDKGTGRIAEIVSWRLPQSFQALRSYGPFGDEGIQTFIDREKLRAFGEVVEPQEEQTKYSPEVLDYVGKRAAIAIIPSAIEYWGDVRSSVSTTGTSENASYPDKREELWKLLNRLQAELSTQQLVLDGAGEWKIVSLSGGRPGAPAVSRGQPGFVTLDPDNFPRSNTSPIRVTGWTPL